MKYLPICVLLIAMCLPATSAVLAVAILCVTTFWMLICSTQPATPLININNVTQVVDPFAELMVGPNMEKPFDSNNPPNADGGDFDYD